MIIRLKVIIKAYHFINFMQNFVIFFWRWSLYLDNSIENHQCGATIKNVFMQTVRQMSEFYILSEYGSILVLGSLRGYKKSQGSCKSSLCKLISLHNLPTYQTFERPTHTFTLHHILLYFSEQLKWFNKKFCICLEFSWKRELTKPYYNNWPLNSII